MGKVILVVAAVALVLYLVIRFFEKRGKGARGAKRAPKPPTRTVAPDDDEDFLRWLERKQRRRGDDAGPSEGDGGTDGGTSGEPQNPAQDG